MTEWQRVYRLGGFRFGCEYWRRPCTGTRSVSLALFGHWFRLEWEIVW